MSSSSPPFWRTGQQFPSLSTCEAAPFWHSDHAQYFLATGCDLLNPWNVVLRATYSLDRVSFASLWLSLHARDAFCQPHRGGQRLCFLDLDGSGGARRRDHLADVSIWQLHHLMSA